MDLPSLRTLTVFCRLKLTLKYAGPVPVLRAVPAGRSLTFVSAFVIKSGCNVVWAVGVPLRVGIDSNIPNRPEAHTRDETAPLIRWGASPFRPQIVVVFRQAEVSVGVVVVPSQGVITKRVQVPFVSQGLPKTNREIV